jgi:hypothetical protein
VPDFTTGLSIYGTVRCDNPDFVKELPDQSTLGYYAEVTLSVSQPFGKEAGCPMFDVPITIEFKESPLIYIGKTNLEMVNLTELLIW